MILFLDFDGVLHHQNVTLKRCHPIKRRHLKEDERRFLTRDGKLAKGKNLFEHADRLATALEPFPGVRIVISSTWREHFRPESILHFLPPSLAERVIGHTPFCSQSSEDGTRLCEVQLYLEVNGHAGELWIALDDQARLFLDDDLIPSDNLFLLNGDEGFTDDAAIVFGDFLRAKFGPGAQGGST